MPCNNYPFEKNPRYKKTNWLKMCLVITHTSMHLLLQESYVTLNIGFHRFLQNTRKSFSNPIGQEIIQAVVLMKRKDYLQNPVMHGGPACAAV